MIIESFKCVKCPEGSEPGDIYPDCDCSSVGEYTLYKNECTKCPENTTGIYPNCTCTEEAIFNLISNICQRCPHESTGNIPNCVCNDGAG